MPELSVTEVEGGIEFEVIAKPKARKEGIDGVHDGALRVAVNAPPDKGKANEALIRVLARLMDVPISDVSIMSGHGSRRKRIRVTGASAKNLLSLIPRDSE
jgi:hypothetical protein